MDVGRPFTTDTCTQSSVHAGIQSVLFGSNAAQQSPLLVNARAGSTLVTKSNPPPRPSPEVK